MTKKMISTRRELCGRHETYSRDEMNALMDKAIEDLGVNGFGATFGVDTEWPGYGDTADYPKFFIFYERLENDTEEAIREKEEADNVKRAEEHERREFARLSAKYA